MGHAIIVSQSKEATQMAYEQVVCDVVWRVTVEQLDGEGRSIVSRESLGDFETTRDAEQKLADEEFTRKQWGWEKSWAYQLAIISRMLVERK